MSDVVLARQGGASAPLGASPAPTAASSSELRDWFALLKPRVVLLVVVTGAVGLFVAPGPIHPVLAATAVLCVAVAAGAAGAINMWWDADIDAVMRRTANRPVPSGRISPDAALAFGVVLSVASVALMGLATNWAAAAWLAASVGFYVFVYTMWLKRRTPQNIVIGGAAGAFPPIVGWVAVTGGVDALPLILFAVVFAWTPPHFWSLALWASGDYGRAGVPMLPVVAGARETRRQILLYTTVLFPLAVSPWPLGLAGPLYGVSAAALGLGFLWHAWRVLRDAQDEAGVSLTRDAPAKAAFRYSLLHLAGLFGALALDHWLLGAAATISGGP